MKIKVYQINPDRDEHRVLFLAHEYLEELQGSPDPDPSVYDMAFEGDVAADNLEGVFRIFNTNQMPVDYCGRSMSVSDVVQIISGGKEKPGYYFCDSFGFKQVAFDVEGL